MIRTIRPLDRPDPGLERVAKANGFSLHAGVSCEGRQKDKRERLCRYIARPAVAVPRLSLSSTGKVLYNLKTPYRDGTRACPALSGTQVGFEGAAIRIDIEVCGRWRVVTAVALPESLLVLRTRTSSTGSWPIFARRNRKPLPAPSSYRQPGRHLGHSLFSRERARGSRPRVIPVQSARTPLNIWSAWNSVCYSLETTTKDLQVDVASVT